MRRKTKYLLGIVIVALALLSPQFLQAQGELTLAGLAEKVEALFTAHDDLAERVSALETPPASTPTATTSRLSAIETARAERLANNRANRTATASALATQRAPAAATLEAVKARATVTAIARVTATARATAPVIATRRPTRKPTATPNVRGESAYRNEIERILVGDGLGYDMESALERISSLFSRAAKNPALMLNNEWKIEVTLTLAVMRQSYQDVRKLKPPNNLKQYHNYLVEGLSYCNLATDYIARGIDNFDADALEDGGGLVDLCAVMIEMAAADPNW